MRQDASLNDKKAPTGPTFKNSLRLWQARWKARKQAGTQPPPAAQPDGPRGQK
jgi:hypothetical protein